MAALCDNCLVIVHHVINVNRQCVVFFLENVLYSGGMCAIIFDCVVRAILVFINKLINHASFEGT